MLVALTAAVPLAIFRQGGQRAYWFGFALFGWLYMLLVTYSWSLDPNTSQSNPLRPYSLVTTQITSGGYSRIYASANTPIYYAPTTGPVSFPYPVNVTGTISNGPYTAYVSGGSPNPVTFYFGTNSVTPAFNGPSHDDFVNVAHAFWAILLASVGGWFTCWLYATRPAKQNDAEANPAAPSASS